MQRLSTVALTRCSRCATSRKRMPCGGSSSSLSSALDAEMFIASAGWITTTRAPPRWLVMRASSVSGRNCPIRIAWLAALPLPFSSTASSSPSPSPSPASAAIEAGSIIRRSGWFPASTSLQPAHSRQGRGPAASSHNQCAAIASAKRRSPVPAVPCTRIDGTSEATAACSAAACQGIGTGMPGRWGIAVAGARAMDTFSRRGAR